ncbi:NAD(P)/FAD-dependent oxidoreductase [Inhella gelatinilytica]|uniref:FAD-dependent oxidoreductase n=1 Tax=Inhella gelatinilytica TaxID=2795030 RepID=A0A931ITJ7_9BURK|nr:FAD-dependent oxidoreductase [Inhella gelatinilytica]MBH9551697.1 FAD-dependent oxidoreductase [Inhella gelatinilytica]
MLNTLQTTGAWGSGQGRVTRGAESPLSGVGAQAVGHALHLLPWLRLRGPAVPSAGPRPQRVAIVGGGISGLGAAWALRGRFELTLFEAEPRLGGHAHTVDWTQAGHSHGVDTGFLVFNERTYPLLQELFRQLAVPMARSDMSFSVQAQGLEWCGSDLNSVFAQRSNLLRPRFWSMLTELLRFNRECTALAERGDDQALAEPVGAFLDRRQFGAAFRELYLLPMVACIWSCPVQQMLAFPIGTLIRFCHNHGLLQVENRPQWFTVQGGSREYVRRLQVALPQTVCVRSAEPVLAVRRASEGVWLQSPSGEQHFDAVILACHSDQALALLGDQARPAERAVLGAIRYQKNRAVLHGDADVLPSRTQAWAAWNFEAGPGDQPVCLHYLINKLQPLPWQAPVVVSLNPRREPQGPAREFEYAHPVFDEGAVRAQSRLPELQGHHRVWFAGAWARYGFHEDGLWSGLQAAHALENALERVWA